MKHQRISLSIAVASVMSAAAFAPAAYAIDVNAGDWKLSIDGNVNAHYIYSRCDTNPATIAGSSSTINIRARLPLPVSAPSEERNSFRSLVTFPFDWPFDFIVFF